MNYKGFKLDFSEEKNLLLIESRGVGFEDIFQAIEEKRLLDDIPHSSRKYTHQRILVVKIKEYIYAVPYIVDKKQNIIFLKTIYPNRILKSKYLKGR